MNEGTKVDDWIPMPDGRRLAVTLYVPHTDAGSNPCIIEALPYRKDDLTSSYRPEYTRLRDEYHYAVARIDVRGTGSSEGRATDEYPLTERTDLAAAMTWLAAQPWCDGNIGMYGTSYSGFNSLQLACEQPPELKAIIAIYATDDRYTDDVHYMGGIRRWVDLVDYCHYMTPLNALPPVPAVFGPGWRDEWRARLAEHEPWILNWTEQHNDATYWRNGSVRPDYNRIITPTMIIAGWADGYRSNSFRTLEALRTNGTPHRLLAGPWSHASTATSIPGPRIDSVPEMAKWWDRWLRGIDNGTDTDPTCAWFAIESHTPAPDLDTVPGVWRADDWPTPRTSWASYELDAREPLVVRPDVGMAAWISCAGHLPYGLPLDQQHDERASLTWDIAEGPLEIAGMPRVTLTLSSSTPVANVVAKLSDVAPNGTSTLVARWAQNLNRHLSLSEPVDLIPGEPITLTVDLEASAHRWLPGHRVRITVAGTDWPNTAAPPGPVTLTVYGGEVSLPLYDPAGSPTPPAFTPGEPTSSEELTGIVWRFEHDVVRRTSSAVVASGGEFYDIPYGRAMERYEGTVSVDTRTFEQTADAYAGFVLDFSDDANGAPVTVAVESRMRMIADASTYSIDIDLIAREGDEVVGTREWTRTFPRDRV
ncbi:MAG: CocE/NonD family hydrolase [Actinobacteria bacterium]|nr:CocE/NonD family hydrolase [Actinomycetota bacterium]